MVEETFDELSSWGSANIKLYTRRFSYKVLLELYGNWARVVRGINKNSPPDMKFSKEYLKWKSWAILNHKTSEQCRTDYIKIITPLNEQLKLIGLKHIS